MSTPHVKRWRIFAAVDLCRHYAVGGYFEYVETQRIVFAKFAELASMFDLAAPESRSAMLTARPGEAAPLLWYERGKMPTGEPRRVYLAGYVDAAGEAAANAIVDALPVPGWSKNSSSFGWPECASANPVRLTAPRREQEVDA